MTSSKMEFKASCCAPSRSSKRIITGLMFLLVGIILILNNLGIIPETIKPILLSWQMFLISLGVVNLIFGGNKRSALILMTIGTFFLLPKIFDIPIETKKLFWPAIFVVIGLVMIFVKNRNSKKIASGTADNFLDVVTFFGGGKQKVSSQNFLGGSIVNVFGGTEIDLTSAEIQQDEVVLDIATVFGGSKIIVPAEWDVKIDVVAILGGFDDKRSRIVTDIPGVKRKVLHIKGVTVFGGGEVKSY